MRHELDAKLCEQYPIIFRDRHGDTRLTRMCDGIAVGDGWYDLLDTLCASLMDIYLREQDEPPRASDGTLDPPIAMQVKEKFGRLTFYLRQYNPAYADVVAFAETMSGRICETCGNPGVPRRSGWHKTRCQACHDAWNTETAGYGHGV